MNDVKSQDVKSIFQLIHKADGTRTPAMACLPREFVEACRKVYGTPDAAGDIDYGLLQNYFVLVIASIDPDDTGLLDRRGISRFPLISLDRFCFMIENPDEYWTGSPLPVGDKESVAVSG